MQSLFVSSKTARVVRGGPFGKHVEGFVEALVATGYQRESIQAKVHVVSQLGQWLERRQLGVHDLNDHRVREFLRWRRRRYRAHRGVEATVVQLLRRLRTIG